MDNRIGRGTRIRLINCTDEYSRLAPGALGTVRVVDDLGTLHIRWDDGGMLGLVPGEDTFEVLEP